MSERLATLLVWTLVGCSAGALALRLLPKPLQAQAQTAAPETLAMASLERLLGRAAPTLQPEAAVQAPGDSRYRLLGLVAARPSEPPSQQGLALIAVGDAPPRALRVGQMVDGDLQLLKVEPHLVSLGRNGVVQVQLRLDAPAPAAQGSLPPAFGMAAPTPVPNAAPQPFVGPTPSPPPAAFPGAAPQLPVPEAPPAMPRRHSSQTQI